MSTCAISQWWLDGVSTSEHAALVVVVGREDVGDGARALDPGVQPRPACRVTRTSHSSAVAMWSTPSSKRSPSASRDRLADRGLGPQSGQLERAAAAVDDPPLAIAREEGGVRRRVVIVEQLEQVREAALLASARLATEAGVAVGAPSNGCRSAGR